MTSKELSEMIEKLDKFKRDKIPLDEWIKGMSEKHFLLNWWNSDKQKDIKKCKEE